MSKLTAQLLLFLCTTAAASAQTYTPGPQVLTFLSSIDDTDQPYALYLPAGFDPAKRYPLVVSLHGAGSNHRLNLKRVFGRGNLAGETDAEASRYFPRFRDVPFIVAAPLVRGTMGYQFLAERDVFDMLADVKRRFAVDDDRVFLTGLSMGGGGTLWLGLTHPDLWAALAPVCPHVPEGADALAANALNLPVRLFQGEADPVVPVAQTRAWQKRLIDLGVQAEYIEYPNVRHNSWDSAYRNAAVFDWFAQFRRNRWPDRVRLVSARYASRTAYWVELDALTPGTLASIDAKFTAANAIEVATEKLDGFTVRPSGHPQFKAQQPLNVTINGIVVRARAASGAFSFHREGSIWKSGRAVVQPKHAGAEGPIVDAVSDRHIYVYGTADKPGPDETRRRREIAERAAAWTDLRLPMQLTLPVKADRDIRDADLDSANLVLFGTRESNSVIARLAPTLPLALNPGAADYGLLYIYPAGRHYVLINSGLPFWTGADDAQRNGYKYGPRLQGLLSTFGDFALFKGSIAQVVTEGRFDRNWKLPSAAASAMTATGTVTVFAK